MPLWGYVTRSKALALKNDTTHRVLVTLGRLTWGSIERESAPTVVHDYNTGVYGSGQSHRKPWR